MNVDDILTACKEIQEQYREPFLVGFEVGTEALRILQGLPREELAFAAVTKGINSIPVRCSAALRPDIVVPILRDASGEETWGEPFSIATKELDGERGGGT